MKKDLWPTILASMLLIAEYSFANDKLELQEVTDNVYAIVGDLGNRTPENLGNNATFGFVVTMEGVVLIDSGGTAKGAAALHDVIKRVTDRPIVKVINSGGQDHRWLGNGYFKDLGAELIASKKAVEDQRARFSNQLTSLANLVGKDAISGTDGVYAERVFDENQSFEVGDVQFELYHAGQAHTPGDVFIWLPLERVMFSGDIVYTKRMLGIGDQSKSKSWIKVYEAMAAYKPEFIVPGHGSATTMDEANHDTYDYLLSLRRAVSKFIDQGGDVTDISQIDQSRFSYLLNFESLAGRNAQQVFTELEWE